MLNFSSIKTIKDILVIITSNCLKVVEFILSIYRDNQKKRFEYLKHQEKEQNKQERFLIEHEQQAKQRKYERIVQQADTKPILILEPIEKTEKNEQSFLISIKLTNIGSPALNISLSHCYNNKYFEFSNKSVELFIYEYLNRTSLDTNSFLTFIIRVMGAEKTDYNEVKFSVCFFDILGRRYTQEFSFFYYPGRDIFNYKISSNIPKCIEDIEIN